MMLQNTEQSHVFISSISFSYGDKDNDCGSGFATEIDTFILDPDEYITHVKGRSSFVINKVSQNICFCYSLSRQQADLGAMLVQRWHCHVCWKLGDLSNLLTILDAARVLPISSMYQDFNLPFTSLLSSLASVLPLMPPLFGIHSLKTSVHHPLWPLLERSSKPISMQRLILLSLLFFWLLCGADLVLSLDSELAYCYCLLRLRVHYSVEIKRYKS